MNKYLDLPFKTRVQRDKQYTVSIVEHYKHINMFS